MKLRNKTTFERQADRAYRDLIFEIVSSSPRVMNDETEEHHTSEEILAAIKAMAASCDAGKSPRAVSRAHAAALADRSRFVESSQFARYRSLKQEKALADERRKTGQPSLAYHPLDYARLCASHACSADIGSLEQSELLKAEAVHSVMRVTADAENPIEEDFTQDPSDDDDGGSFYDQLNEEFAPQAQNIRQWLIDMQAPSPAQVREEKRIHNVHAQRKKKIKQEVREQRYDPELIKCKQALQDEVDNRFGADARIATFEEQDGTRKRKYVVVTTTTEPSSVLHQRSSTGTWHGLMCATAKQIRAGTKQLRAISSPHSREDDEHEVDPEIAEQYRLESWLFR